MPRDLDNMRKMEKVSVQEITYNPSSRNVRVIYNITDSDGNIVVPSLKANKGITQQEAESITLDKIANKVEKFAEKDAKKKYGKKNQ